MVVHPDGWLVRRTGREQFEEDLGGRSGAVAVDDRVVEGVDTDESRFRRVHDGRRRADVDRPVAGDTDGRDRDRLAVRVVVIGGHLNGYGHAGSSPDGVVDGDGRIVDAVVVGLAHLGFDRRRVVGARCATLRPAFLHEITVLAQHEDPLRVLVDRTDPPGVHRPHEVTGEVVGPHEVDRRGHRQGSVGGHARGEFVENLAGPPVDADDRARPTLHDRCRITADRQEIGTVDVQTPHRARLLDARAGDAPEIVVGADPTARCGRSGDLTDDLARIGVGGQQLPRPGAETCTAVLRIDHQGHVADQGQRSSRHTERRGLRCRRRRSPQITAHQRPDGTIGCNPRVRSRLDGERDRVAVRRDDVCLVLIGIDDDESGLPDPSDRAPRTEGRQTERRAEPQLDAVDRLCFSGDIVEQVGAGAALGDRELVALGARVEARQRSAAVAVDQHDATGGPMNEPTRRPAGGGVDRRQAVGTDDDHRSEQREQRGCDGGHDLTPAHGGRSHDVLKCWASDGYSRFLYRPGRPQLEQFVENSSRRLRERPGYPIAVDPRRFGP